MKLTNVEIAFIVEQLISWFRATKRDLPWRKTYDPYHVWISEIMLQQTQMDRGVRYFNRWIERFPGVQDVAEASENDILHYWEGLGYYARARNLHKAAQIIVNRFSSAVPDQYNQLIELPGIGPYTAAAVASIAGNQDVVVIDANVNRIFARILDIDTPVKNRESQKTIQCIAEKMLPRGRARAFNQALMDFGGLVCTPKQPCCRKCVLQQVCKAHSKGTVSLRPVLKSLPKTIRIERHVALIIDAGSIYMQKRNKSKLWQGLWDFPGGQSVAESGKETSIDLVTEVKEETGLDIVKESFLVTVQHQYTHHKITLHAHLCSLKNKENIITGNSLYSEYRWMTPAEMDKAPCPSGIRKVIRYFKEIHPKMFSGDIVK